MLLLDLKVEHMYRKVDITAQCIDEDIFNVGEENCSSQNETLGIRYVLKNPLLFLTYLDPLRGTRAALILSNKNEAWDTITTSLRDKCLL